MNQCWYKYNPALLWSFVCFPFIPLMVSQKKKRKKKDITPSNILVWAMHKRSTLKNGVFSLVCISMLKKICGVTSMDEFKILSYREPKYKEKKKNQIDIYVVLKNYKNTKSSFVNTLRCNHLSTKKKQNNVFFNIRLARIFFFFLG